ncbi:GlxA family transcriptional regulator [Streptomyces sp. NPDC048442]|uniref:GlxA family transcriptional regulator n=1 Tax=Streptomyces sp. NPDC048442 TaxID=3154823 RepID=UPI00343D53BE
MTLRPPLVLVVLFDDVQSIDVTGPVEVFAGVGPTTGTPYEIRTASLDGTPVRTSSGLTLVPDGTLTDFTPRFTTTATPPPTAPTPPARDTTGPPASGTPALAPASGTPALAPASGTPALTLLVPGGPATRRSDPRLIDWLRTYAPRADRLVSVCSGALVLAEAGLLDGRRAATHWTVTDRLARDHPAVEVDPEAIYVRDGNVSTSAGVTSGIDLALALVEEDHGRDVALSIARHLVVFLRRPGNQAQFSAQLSAQTAQREPLRDVQQYISEHPAADLCVESLAARAGLSPRHFARAFHIETGTTPGRYVERVRLEHARRLLEDSADGVEGISRTCGYGTPEAMRRAFVKALGTAPAEYRRRFRSVCAL